MDQVTTVKIPNLPQQNEIDYYRALRQEAKETMLEEKTPESITAFAFADAMLWEVQDKYRLGKKLLLLYKATHAYPRRNYISYNENQTIQLGD